MKRSDFGVVLLGVWLSHCPASMRGATYDVQVDGSDAIFLAGRSDVAIPHPDWPWTGPDGGYLTRHSSPTPEEIMETLPSFIPVTANSVVSAVDPAVGGISFFRGWGGTVFGPNGNGAVGSSLTGLAGISGYIGPQGPLTGVFLGDEPPSSGPAPATLDFTPDGFGVDFVSLEPVLRQVFYIGDGRTSSGVLQSFRAPVGATRLFLGIPDGFGFNGPPGAYDDNDGFYRVHIGVNELPLAITIEIASGTLTQTQAGHASFTGGLPLTKSGAGTLIVHRANSLTGSTSVQAGTLQLAHSSALASSRLVPLSGGMVTLSPGLKTMIAGLVTNAGGVIDVGNGLITVASGLAATDLVAALHVGRGDGGWNGSSGITSSEAAASGGSRSVGWLDNGDGSVTFGYAAPGDTNLDWVVDLIDVLNFVSSGKYGVVDPSNPASWAEGDFNYDGLVDLTDVVDFSATGLYGAGEYDSSSGGVAAVPEPSACTTLAAGAGLGGVSMWRRRKRAYATRS